MCHARRAGPRIVVILRIGIIVQPLCLPRRLLLPEPPAEQVDQRADNQQPGDAADGSADDGSGVCCAAGVRVVGGRADGAGCGLGGRLEVVVDGFCDDLGLLRFHVVTAQVVVFFVGAVAVEFAGVDGATAFECDGDGSADPVLAFRRAFEDRGSLSAGAFEDVA